VEIGYVDGQACCMEVLCYCGIPEGVQAHPDCCVLPGHCIAEDLGNTDLR
jgi:hypothetical protein